MNNLYFVISQFDTDANVDVYDKAGLLKELNEWKESGDEYDFIESLEELEELGFNPAEWSYKRLIIKGTIIVPKPKKVIETFEIE